MPNKVSAAKRVRQNERRRARNRSKRSELRTLTRKTIELAEAGKPEDAVAALQLAQSKIAKAAKGPVMKKETASRKISRLAKQVARGPKKA